MNEKIDEVIEKVKEIDDKIENNKKKSSYDWWKDIIIPLSIPVTLALLSLGLSIYQTHTSQKAFQQSLELESKKATNALNLERQKAHNNLELEHLKLVFAELNSDDDKQLRATLFLEAMENNEGELVKGLAEWRQRLNNLGLLGPKTSREVEGISSPLPPRTDSPSGIDLSKYTIYIQVSSDSSYKLVQELVKNLKEQGYVVPGVEKISFKFSNGIRYYGGANDVVPLLKTKVNDFLKNNKLDTIKSEPQNLHERYKKVKPNIIELWINL